DARGRQRRSFMPDEVRHVRAVQIGHRSEVNRCGVQIEADQERSEDGSLAHASRTEQVTSTSRRAAGGAVREAPAGHQYVVVIVQSPRTTAWQASRSPSAKPRWLAVRL